MPATVRTVSCRCHFDTIDNNYASGLADIFGLLYILKRKYSAVHIAYSVKCIVAFMFGVPLDAIDSRPTQKSAVAGTIMPLPGTAYH
jgi:hypothetical protein